jgi:hypothetical protein
MPFQLLQIVCGAATGEELGQRHHRALVPERLFADDPQWRAPLRDLYDPATPALACAADLVLLHAPSQPEAEAIIRWRRERGRATIVEIADDLGGVGGWLPPNSLAHSPLSRQHILYHAHLADLLQVSSQPLADLYRTVNPRRFVAENSVPIPAAPPAKGPGFVFGWGGSTSHVADLAAIAPAVLAFCQRHPDATFAYMGARQLCADLFGGLPAGQLRQRDFGPYDDYLACLGELHIGVAPLEESRFNAGRTDVKLVEYAASGAAPLVADHPVYRPHAAHARLFCGPGGLAEALEDLYARPEARAELAGRAFAWARAARGPAAVRAARAERYRALLPADAAPADGAPPPEQPGAAAALHQAHRALARRDHEAALAGALALLAEWPSFEQARWLGLACLAAMGRAAEALEYAAGWEPGPLYADIAYTTLCRMARLARPADAPAYYARVRSPLRRLALNERPPGDVAERYRAILAVQPYDYFALRGLILLLERAPAAAEELAGLRERINLLETQPTKGL